MEREIIFYNYMGKSNRFSYIPRLRKIQLPKIKSIVFRDVIEGINHEELHDILNTFIGVEASRWLDTFGCDDYLYKI